MNEKTIKDQVVTNSLPLCLEFSRFFEKISEWATGDIQYVVLDAESDGGKKNPKK